MTTKWVELQEIYSPLIKSFGHGHAKIFHALLCSDAKTANQLLKETRLRKDVLYRTLRELVRFNLIQCAGKHPAVYFVDDPIGVFDFQKQEMINTLRKKRNQLKSFICNLEDFSGEEYVLKIDDTQTKIIDNKTRLQVAEAYELNSIKKKLDQAISQSRFQDKLYAVYR